MTKSQTFQRTRIESDLLGEEALSEEFYYGIQTERARRNFDLSGVQINHFPQLVRALAMVKKASAMANMELGCLSVEQGSVICRAADLIVQGRYHEQFVVDMIQGGAGTSTNMNVNEVIANIGLELMGHRKGEYQFLHPNNHVNMSQSTNDAYPTAVRVSLLLSHKKLLSALSSLQLAFADKAIEFDHIMKMGRTQLQDAVPMTLGQEFGAYATTLGEDIERIAGLSNLLKEVNLGGTAIGTGINARQGYAAMAVTKLADISGFDLVPAKDLIEASSDMGAFVLFSSMLKRLAVKLSKICNDLRLLSSGPRAGLGEINLPAQQPGSSIMPGKVNPVIPEAVNQVAYQVIGNDLAITMAAEAGQLQLNAMEPLIAFNSLESIRILTKSMAMLEEKCIRGITANEERCKQDVENSIGIITLFNPVLGYEPCSRIAKRALREGRGVIELILEEGLLSQQEIDALMTRSNLIGPGSASPK